MTDYQPTEADKVLLDYAQTAQRRADPWVEFEYCAPGGAFVDCHQCCSPIRQYDRPTLTFRRKPLTCKLVASDGREWELPVPEEVFTECEEYTGIADTGRQWVTALRELVGGENG